MRRGELVTLVIGRERRVLVDRIQATMAVVEGHAEHVMDAVGAEVIPSQAELRAALERRRQDRSGPMRLLERVLGFELKLRQYRDGKRFCDHVVERVGIEGLNRVWSAPHALPTLAELGDPDAWIARTAVPFVTKLDRSKAPQIGRFPALRRPTCNNPGRRTCTNRRSLVYFVIVTELRPATERDMTQTSAHPRTSHEQSQHARAAVHRRSQRGTPRRAATREHVGADPRAAHRERAPRRPRAPGTPLKDRPELPKT